MFASYLGQALPWSSYAYGYLRQLNVGHLRRPPNALAPPPRRREPFFRPLRQDAPLELRERRHHRIDEEPRGGRRVDMQIGDLKLNTPLTQLLGFGQGVHYGSERTV